MNQIEWHRQVGQYQHGWDGFIGTVKVAEVVQPTQSKGYDGPTWRAEVLLPGIKVKVGLLKDTDGLAKLVAESVTREWFNRLNPPTAANPNPRRQ